jgi:aspartate--ammonia ligase
VGLEKVITPEERNEETLRQTVLSIVDAVYYTQQVLCAKYDVLTPFVSRDVTFITAQELLNLYPDCDPKEREYRFVKQHPTTFIMGIGAKLSDGKPHDGRAPDYDDWSLNGDILFYNPLLDCAFEISSMGVRVDAKALDEQLSIAGCDNRRALPFHKMLLDNKLPQTIGGGIGQSRLCMLLLNKAHIGEVQSSLWDAETQALCDHAGVILL